MANDANPPMEYSPVVRVQKDLLAGVVVFLVALPLCLGIAAASNAPLISGLVTGIVGGIVVGALSGSHTSVSGPAAGLTAIVAAQIATLGSFEAFLVAVIIGGLIQIFMGVMQWGKLAAFFPSSVIKGLLAAIGVILILKQLPHLFGHDTDPEGEMSLKQPDHETTFSSLEYIFTDFHLGAATIGILGIVLLLIWDRIKVLKNSPFPGPFMVVLVGVGMALLFEQWGSMWSIRGGHTVNVPVPDSPEQWLGLLSFPDFSVLTSASVYIAGITVAIVASLETLLNLEAVDRLDLKRRHSPPSRELWAQGVGNVISGFLGGLPMTSVIIRSSVNVNNGAQTKLSAIFHGFLLMFCVGLMPQYLNRIPLASLAAILIVTGFKLASPKLVKQMWSEGRYQFAPFIITVLAIVLTDLLIGILIGLGVSLLFILNSNLRKPLRKVVEKHVGGEVMRIELANQVSFLNRASLDRALREIPDGGQVLIDARDTDYIDPDVLSLIRDFKETDGPARGIQVSLLGFRSRYQLRDEILYVDYSTRELQSQLTPAQVLEILREGNERFRSGHRMSRDLGRQVEATAAGQHPMAVVLSCIDSRTPAELILDLGLGDIFSTRVAGNILSRKILGSIEYGVIVAGAKLVVVLGHTRCGAVTAAVNHVQSLTHGERNSELPHVQNVLKDIELSIDPDECRRIKSSSESEQADYVDDVARKNVARTVQQILDQSAPLRRLAEDGKVGIVGGMYDVRTARIEFFHECCVGLTEDEVLAESPS